MKRRSVAIVASLFLAAVSGRGQQSSAAAEASAAASVVPALSVQKTQDLIVGAFRPGDTLGTVDVDVPTSSGGERSSSGGVTLAASSFSAAQFNVTAAGAGPVHFAVVLPSDITIQRIGGVETMRVDGFRTNVSPDCLAGSPPGACPGSPYTLLVGATLHVNARQAAGQYVGTFTVTVNQL
jgi:hypothetical protein